MFNKNWNKLKLLAVAVISATTLGAHAGQEGHGGGAYLCPNPKDNELLDFYEAGLPNVFTENGIKIVRSNAPVGQQVQDALNKLNFGSPLYTAIVQRMQHAMKFKPDGARQYIPKGSEIPKPADALTDLDKQGCSPKGVALYKDKKDLLWWDPRLDDTANPLLANTDLAGLIIHESVYKFLRDTQGDQNSVRAQTFVAYLFSSEPTDVVQKKLRELTQVNVSGSSTLTREDSGHFVMHPGFPGQEMIVGLKFQPSQWNPPGCYIPKDFEVSLNGTDAKIKDGTYLFKTKATKSDGASFIAWNTRDTRFYAQKGQMRVCGVEVLVIDDAGDEIHSVDMTSNGIPSTSSVMIRFEY